MKSKTIDSFFKKKSTKTTQSPSEASQIEVPPSSFVSLNSDARPSKIPRVEDEALDLSNLECEPGLRKQIYEYPVNMRDEIRRAYIKDGPYQPILSEYPAFNSKKHPRYFQASWFKQFSYNPSSRFRSTAFTHNGFNLNSLHNNAQRAYVDLMNQAQHIEVSLHRQTTQQILANRLRLKTSIDVVRWLSFQGCAFKGHDESSRSKNRGNFLELLLLLASYDEKVEDILKSALQNASYTSSTIQKEILQIHANRVRNVIHEEIGDRKFSIIMDEVKERFFDIVHVKDTASLTLKNVIFNVLLQHNFDIQNIRGQGYDGTSNMCGEFNGLQALILNDYRYAYHIGTLQHPGETQWSSHLNSVTSLLKMYNATSTVLENLKNTTSNYSQRGNAHNAYNRLRSFELYLILHMMNEVLGITGNLCQALQRRSQDILNAMSLVLTTKYLIQKLRNDGWNELLKNVISFCETWELDFPDMNAQYIVGRSRNKKEDVTVEHHYQVDIFFATIDTQLQELKSRFNENFYLEDFSQQEKEHLPYELKHYELDVCKHPYLRKILILSKLCRSLVESGKSVMYPLVDRLIRLILTLPVSTASSEHTFSAMKIVKT
ncbi:hypothetical protein ES332_D06G187000v1 [Gossypium tomentosum]|uniref:DUF4371 domain-containing protein n=1 Tax=Gossypium tomentosum TaxID=34277 RepID=A0A5D2KKT2_GOSTO|nr:hypothetical protein ES332_D06G187000v1 [Gossypium tomentosum]